MKRSTRILAPIVALLTVVGGIWIASASAQTDPQPTAPLGTYCPPIPANAVAGQDIVCKVIADPFWTPPTTTPPTSTTTTVPTTTTTSSTTTTAPPVTTTTSAPPAAALKGWELTTSNVGLAPHGLNCNTMPMYDGPNRPDRGRVITGVRIEKYIDMSNGDVTLDKVCLRPRTQGMLGSLASTTVEKLIGGEVRCCFYGLPLGTTATIRDSEIDGSLISAGNIAGANGFDGAANLYRNYIHDTGSGIAFRETGTWMNFQVENNLVTKLRHAGDAHHEAATVRDFVENSTNTRSVTFKGNRFEVYVDSATGGLFIQDTWVRIRNVNVWDNYFSGAGYLLRTDQRHTNGVTGVRSVNNRFTPTGWGPATSNVGWAEWSSNYRYDPARLNAAGAVVNP